MIEPIKMVIIDNIIAMSLATRNLLTARMLKDSGARKLSKLGLPAILKKREFIYWGPQNNPHRSICFLREHHLTFSYR